MLQRRDHYDEDALDAMAGAEQYWMRFFASLRMTTEARPSSAQGSRLPQRLSPLQLTEGSCATTIIRTWRMILLL
jgi:hypothetical protein